MGDGDGERGCGDEAHGSADDEGGACPWVVILQSGGQSGGHDGKRGNDLQQKKRAVERVKAA